MAIEIQDPCLTGTQTTECKTVPGFVYTTYPCQIDTSNQLPIAVDGQTPLIAEVNNRLRESIIAVESELGVQPSGTYTTVRARLDSLDVIVCSLQVQIDAGTGSPITIQEDGINVLANTGIINFTGPGVSVTQNGSNKVDVTITGSGSTIVQVQESIPVTINGQTAFILSLAPFDDSTVKMYVNGIKQEFGNDYSVTGTAVTYLGAPALVTTDDVEFWYLGTGTAGILVEQESFTAIAAQINFTLSQTPDDDTAVEMFIDGIKQEYSADYTVSGTAVTYNNLPPLTGGEVVEFWYIYSGTGGGGSQTLAQTLVLGNLTGGNNILISDGDFIEAGSDGYVDILGGLNVSSDVSISGNIDLNGELDSNANFIRNILNPVLPQDAATKAYVDGAVSGFPIDATGTTIGGTLTTIATYVMPVNTGVLLEISVSGREQGGLKAAGYLLTGMFLENGGVTQIGVGTTVSQFESDPGYTAELNPVGGNVLIQVRGVVAETIDWHVRGSVLENS